MATPQKSAARPAAKPAPKATQPAPRPAAKPAPAPARAAPAKPAPAPKHQPPAVRQSTAVAGVENLPEHLRASAQQGLTRGNENVDMQDMVIPRIELIQALSPQLQDTHGKYIEGAKQGQFYNSVTNELYGDSVVVCPVTFKKQYLVWKDRNSGGGFGGAYDSYNEAQDRINQEQDAAAWEAMETAQQIVLVVNQETGETTEAVISMARTKMKVSKQWNSLIRINGFDRFSRLYEVFSIDEQNQQNQSYKNMSVRTLDFAPVEVYKRAEALYGSIEEGARRVVVDTDYSDDAIPGESAPTGDSEGGEY